MPIAQIIDDIDAYLILLRQARDLLSAARTEVIDLKRSVPRKKRVSTEPARPALSGKPRIQASKSRPVRQAPKQQKADRIANPVAAVAAPVVEQAARPQQVPAAIAQISAVDANKDGLLPKTPTVVKARVRRMGTRGAISRKPEAAIKPAIALAGSVHSKVVVVSAAQLQREREQAAPAPVVQRPRIPSSGLNGRLAFEALFKN